MKTGELVQLRTELEIILSTHKLPILAKFRFNTKMSKLRPLVEAYNSANDSLLVELGVERENEPGLYDLTPKNSKKYMAEMKTLFDAECSDIPEEELRIEWEDFLKLEGESVGNYPVFFSLVVPEGEKEKPKEEVKKKPGRE